MFKEITSSEFRQARERIQAATHHTPVMTSNVLNKRYGLRLYFKCENLQKTGSFKARGAANIVFSLHEHEAHKGVVAHSSGNHAAALANAATMRGIPSFVVMPRDAPRFKIGNAQRYGARVTLCEPTYTARKEVCAQVMRETGATLAHSSDDIRIIIGQGTTGCEFVEDVDDLDVILAPVGGGGLTAGLALAMTYQTRRPDVLAVEPAQADDAYRSLRAGQLLPPDSHTIADGLRTGLGEAPFDILSRCGTEIITVSEEAIVAAMREIWEVLKIVVEPSAAVPFAALVQGLVPDRYKRIGVVLSGGNLDLNHLPWQTNGAAHPRVKTPEQV